MGAFRDGGFAATWGSAAHRPDDPTPRKPLIYIAGRRVVECVGSQGKLFGMVDPGGHRWQGPGAIREEQLSQRLDALDALDALTP